MKRSLRHSSHTRRLVVRVLLAVVVACASAPVSASQSLYWDNSGGTANDWASFANWSLVDGATTGFDPVAAFANDAGIYYFNTTGLTAAQTINLNGGRSPQGMIFRGFTLGTTLLGGTGDQTLTVSNGNPYGFAGIQVDSGAGAVTIGSTTAGQRVNVSLSAAQLWTNNSSNTLTITNGVTMAANTLMFGGTGNTVLTGNTTVLTGTAGFTKIGSGTLTLNGVNTYTGTTTLNGGIVNLGSANTAGVSGPLGATNTVGSIVLNGGTLQHTAANTADYSNRFSTAAAQRYNVDTNSQTVTWATALTSSNGTMNKSGAGTLILSNANTFGGPTTISGGAVQLNNSLALQNSTVTVSAANGLTFNAGLGSATLGGLSGASSFALQDTGATAITLSVGNNGISTTHSGNLSGSGALTKIGSGTLTLSTANSYTGLTTVSAGALNIQNSSSLGTSAAGTSVTAGAALQLQGGVTFNSGEALTLNGTGIGTTGALRSVGGANIWQSTVTLGSDSRIEADAGSSLTFNTAATSLTGAFTATLGGAGTGTVSGIVATTALTKAGTGTWTLTGANSYTGLTTINGGTLIVGDGTTGSLNGTTGTALTFSGSGVLNVSEASGVSQGMGTLTFSAGDGTVQSTNNGGTSSLTFSSLAARTAGATGNFVLSGGTAGTPGTPGGGVLGTNNIVLTGVTASQLIDRGLFYGGSSYAAYDAAGFVRGLAYGTDTNAPAPIGTGATLGVNNAALNVQITGAITGQTTASVNTLHIAGANNVTLASGTLSLNGILKTGGNAATITGGTSLNTTASGNELVIRTDAAADSLTINSVIAANGTNALTKTGAGTLTLGVANTYTGVTNINAGTVKIGNITGLGTTAAGTVVGSGATLDLNGITIGAELLTLNGPGASGAGALTNTSATGVTYSSNITLGSAATITASNGNILINNGTVTLGAFNLTLDGTGTGTIGTNVGGGLISGTGGIIKTGTGTWTLARSGGNTFTGGIVVKAGTLQSTENGGFGPAGSFAILGDTSGSANATLASGVDNGNPNLPMPITVSGGNTGVATISVASASGAITLINHDLTFKTIAGYGTGVTASSSISGTGNITMDGTVGTAAVTLSGTNINPTGTITSLSNATNANVISGSLGPSVTGVIVNGNTLSLTGSGSQGYAGGFTINSGTLTTNNNINLGTGTITLAPTAGATARFIGTNTGTPVGGAINPFVIAGDPTGIAEIGTNITYLRGPISLSSHDLVIRLDANESPVYWGNMTGTGNLELRNNSGAGLNDISYRGLVDIAGTITGTGVGRDTFLGGGVGQNVTGITQAGTATLKIGYTNAGTVNVVVGGGGLVLTNSSGALFGLGGSTGGAPAGRLVGTGNLTLNANNNTQGITFDNAGGTYIINNAGTITNSGTGTADQTIGSGAQIQSNVTGVIQNSATSRLVLAGANTYTTLTQVLAGALNIQNATALGTTATGTTVSSGAQLQIQGGITVGAEALTLSGTGIANTGALRNISGTNTFNGTVTLNTSSRINSDAGSLTLGAASSITGTNTNLTLGGAGTGTVSGTIATGAGTVTKDGTGTWTLGGTNSYTGTTTINNGILRVNGSTHASSAVNVNAGAYLGGSGTVNGAVTVAALGGTNLLDGAAGTLTLTNGSGLTYNGTVANPNYLFFDLNGTTNLDKIVLTTGGHSAAGPVGSARIYLNNNSGTMSNGLHTLIQGGAASTFTGYQLATTAVGGKVFSLATSGNTLQLSAASGNAGHATPFWSGATDASWQTITNWNTSVAGGVGTGSVPGTSSAVTFNTTTPVATNLSTTLGGDIEISSLTYAATANSAVGIGGANTLSLISGNVTVSSTAAVTHTISANVGIEANGAWNVTNAPAALNVSGSLTDFGAGRTLTKSGAGTLILSGDNSAYFGAITVSAGALNVQHANALGSPFAGTTVSSGAALQVQGGITLNSAEILSINGTGIGGTGALRNISGANIVAGTVTLAGATRINSDADSLTLSAANAISGGQNLTLGGASTGANTISGTMTIGTLTKDGAGTWTLSPGSANTYTGLTTVSAGTLAYGANDAIGTGGVTVSTGGTLAVGAFTDTVGAVTVNDAFLTGTGTLTSTSGFTFNPSFGFTNTNGNVNLAGAVNLLKATSLGTTVLGDFSTYTGTTTVNAPGSAGTSTLVITSIQNAGSATPNSLGTPSVGNSTINLLKATNPSGDPVLKYTGSTNGSSDRPISMSSPGLSNSITTGSWIIDASGAATFALSGGINIFNAANMTGNGSNGLVLTGTGVASQFGAIVNTHGSNANVPLNKSGSGTWILGGTNTITGPTYVNQGTLTLDYSVNNTSKLADGGALNLSNATVNLKDGTHAEIVNGMTLNAGASSITRQSVSSVLRMNAITRNAGSTLNFGADSIASTTTTNTNNILGGYATVGGTDWATRSASVENGSNNYVTALTSGSYTNTSTALNVPGSYSSANVNVNSNQAPTGTITPNSFRFNNPAANTLTLFTGTNAMTGGGILVTSAVGANESTLSGGILQASGELIVHQHNTAGGLTINSNVGGTTSGLTKSGAGNLTLSGSNFFTGQTTINGTGTIFLTGGNNRLAAGGNLHFTGNGTLDIGSNRQYVGALSTLYNDATTGGAVTGSGTLTANGTGTFAGGINGSVNLAKVGTSTTGTVLTLTNPSSTTGTLTVMGTMPPSTSMTGGLTLRDGGTLAAVGAISVRNAILMLDNTGTQDLSNRLNESALTLDGGVIAYNGRAGVNSTESLGAVSANSGLSAFRLNSGTPGANTATLTLASLTQGTTGGTVSFRTTTSGTVGATGGNPIVQITSAPTLTNNILPWAVVATTTDNDVNVYQFASYIPVTTVNGLNKGGIGRIDDTGSGYAGHSGSLGVNNPASNVRITSNTAVLAGGVQVNSLTAQNGIVSFSAATDVLNLTSGGMLTGTNAGGGTMGGALDSGRVTAGGATSAPLYVWGGRFGWTLNSRIIDNPGGGSVQVVLTRAGISGGGTITMANGNNTYSGGTVFNANDTTSVLALTGAGATVGNPIAVIPSGGFMINAGSVTTSAAQQISSLNTVKMEGGATLTLTGANTLAGLEFNNIGGTLTNSASTLTLTGNISSTPINLAFTPSITTGSLTSSGTNMDITVAAYADGNMLNLTTPTNGLTISSIITGGSGLSYTKKGTGVLNLAATANTFFGQLTVEDGVVNVSSVNNVSANGPLGNSTLAVILGKTGGQTGTLEYSNSGSDATSSKPFTMATGGTGAFQVDAAARTVTLTGLIDGGGSLAKTGLGALTLTGTVANTYSGNTIISNGTLKVGTATQNMIPNGAGKGNVVLDGGTNFAGTFDLNNFNETINGLSGTSNLNLGQVVNNTGGLLRTLTVGDNDANASFAGIIRNNTTGTGTVALTKIGTGTQALSGANTYTGVTTVNAGILRLDSQFALSGGIGAAGGTSALTFTGGVLGLGAGDFSRGLGTGAAQVQWTGSGGYAAFTADRNVNLGGASAGVTWNSGSFVPTGSALILSASTATHTVDFQNPISFSTAQRTVQVDNGSAAIDAILSGNLTGGGGGLDKTGLGTLRVTGTNSYSGATNVNAGTLLVNGTHTGGSTYTVAAGATLGGTGSIASVVTGAGLGSPGNSPGIFTTLQTDPSGGLDFAFEFTSTGDPDWDMGGASVNDVWRVTHGTTPFPFGPFDGDNIIDIYFNVASLTDGDEYRGGFFTDLNSDFLATVSGAAYNFYVSGDGNGTDAIFEGVDYYTLANYNLANASSFAFTVGTVQIPLADFSGPDVNNGWVMRFNLPEVNAIPEPSTYALGLLGLAGLVLFALRRKHRRA